MHFSPVFIDTAHFCAQCVTNGAHDAANGLNVLDILQRPADRCMKEQLRSGELLNGSSSN